MASKYLGEYIDIHCGGIDHISVHHTNEIAQSEGCFGHQWVNTWMHGEFLVLDKGKMSKSKGGFLTLQSLRDEGFEPAYYRYLCLGAHYRSQLFFSFEALQGAKNAFESLKNRVISWKLDPQKGKDPDRAKEYAARFKAALANDLDMPVAMSVLWEAVKDGDLGSKVQLELLTQWDRVLGFGVDKFEKPALSDENMTLVREREAARLARDWAKSDELRAKLLEQGICLKDSPTGTDWYLQY
jgi:cysteinyl-tRNA synthetase